MKLKRIVLAFILALASTMLDISFFSFFELSGVTIFFSFIVLVTIALYNDWDTIIAFSCALSLVFAVFSSLPIIAIFVLFFGIPALIYHIRKSFLPEGSLFISAVVFLAATLIAETVMLITAKEFNVKAFLSLGYFVLYNTIFGVAVWAGLRKAIGRWQSGEIKI